MSEVKVGGSTVQYGYGYGYGYDKRSVNSRQVLVAVATIANNIQR
jgi:hypothetical protein